MGWLMLAGFLLSVFFGGWGFNYLNDLESNFPEGWEDALNGDPDKLGLLCGIVVFMGGVLFVLGFFKVCYRDDIPAVKLVVGELSAASMLLISYLVALINERYNAVYDSIISPYKKYLESDNWESRSYGNKAIANLDKPEEPDTIMFYGCIVGIVGGVLAVIFLLKFAEKLYSKNRTSAVSGAVCYSCGKSLVNGAKFCTRCGASQASAGKACVNCGKSLEEDAVFCSACGTEQYATDTEADIFYDEDGGEYALCSSCGAVIKQGASFCSKCGTKL